MGYIYLSTSLGILLGPLLGGVVFDRVGYDAVFVIAYALVGFDVALRFFAVEKGIAKQWLNSHERANSQDSAALELQERPQPTDEVEAETQRADAHALEHKAPSLVTLLKSTRLLVALWGSLVIAILMTSLDAVLPLYVKATFDWTSFGAGMDSSHPRTYYALLTGTCYRIAFPRHCCAIILGPNCWLGIRQIWAKMDYDNRLSTSCSSRNALATRHTQHTLTEGFACGTTCFTRSLH